MVTDRESEAIREHVAAVVRWLEAGGEVRPMAPVEFVRAAMIERFNAEGQCEGALLYAWAYVHELSRVARACGHERAHVAGWLWQECLDVREAMLEGVEG